jgi:hypothetical protein
MSDPKKPYHNDEDDKMHPQEPSQAELDKDRKANPDTSKQVDGADRDAGSGGGGDGGGGNG